MPTAPRWIVVAAGCLDGLGHGAADHVALALASCVAAIAGLLLLLFETDQTVEPE